MKREAIYELIDRVLPGKRAYFELEQVETEAGCNVFELDSREGTIILRGDNAVSMAAGLGWYIRTYLKGCLSWCGSRMDQPEELPLPKPYRRVIAQKYRAYMNYCTFQYSASWWNWERWEKELDLMALSGINLPLCTVGLEAVWYETLCSLGLPDEEARSCISAPAFLAWQWMGNIDGFLGPIPKDWLKQRLELGRKILSRMLELDMTPIQQGFSGAVPKKLIALFPKAKVTESGKWFGVESTAQLDPTDPLFQTIGSLFLKEQDRLFGSYGHYAADPFHEGKPPVDTPDYLARVGAAVHNLVRDFDPKGICVMQSWSIRREIVLAMPKADLLILDLNGVGHQKHDSFWGYSFVTGNLHNFGGRTKLHGDLKLLSENQFLEIKKTAKNVCGTGLFMEGIEQNPIYYDLAFEMLTAQEPVALDTWLKDYGERRYGTDSPLACEALKILAATAYAPGTNGVENSSIVCARPAVDVKKSGPNAPLHLPYGNRRLLRACRLLQAAGGAGEGYEYDRVDWCRQLLSNYGEALYAQVSEAYKNREADSFQKRSAQFLELLEDLDEMLGSVPLFTLQKWISEARAWGETPEEKAYLEHNAKVLLTLWGPEEEPWIFDYSWREWNGLIRSFYLPRWRRFFDMLSESLKQNQEYYEDTLPKIYGRESWRANEFYDTLANWEAAWTRERFAGDKTRLDAKKMARKMLDKYGCRI